MEEQTLFKKQCLLMTLLISSLVHKGYMLKFEQHKERRLTLVLQPTVVESAVLCCWMCSRNDICFSASYNVATKDCLLSQVKSQHVIENSVGNSGWITYSKIEWLLVFRAVAGNGMSVSSWFEGTPAASNDIKCKALDEMSCSFYRHPWVDNWASIPHKKVKYALHKDGQEVAVILFNGTGSTSLSDWFSNGNFLSSSWDDVDTNNVEIRITNSGSGSRHFLIVKHGGVCAMDIGYTITVDGNICCGCIFDVHNSYPQFLYASTATSSLLESADMDKADDMTIYISDDL